MFFLVQEAALTITITNKGIVVKGVKRAISFEKFLYYLLRLFYGRL